NISDLYLPGIPVGYITDMSMDSNNLTKSGTVATIVDFEHLEKVFVLLETKDSITENEGE
ncbi:MAG: rod shape-determining protein MreC, partial [Clostridiales bacterium]|nr:rod shape-determining protein MreC [Clostridiales bacterium]